MLQAATWVFGAWVFGAWTFGAWTPEAPEQPAVAPKEVAAKPVPASWRFRKDDKPVKVVVLAGSIGAYRRKPYAKEIERLCANIEVKNISKVGLGAWPLKQHFKLQVLRNRAVKLADESKEYWLVFGGGINSIGTPYATNHHIKNTFVLAHMNHMKVVGLTLTPWGDDRDRRFRGAGGLHYRDATALVADFVLGRGTPAQVLGSYARKRPAGAEGDWDPLEVADVGIDLYDSPLRDADATPRDLEVTRKVLAKDKGWKRAHAKLSEQLRAQALEADALRLSQLPQWYLRADLRTFDHIHMNTQGHKIIADTMCPKLPSSWGCRCDDATLSPAQAAPDSGSPALGNALPGLGDED